LKTRTPGTELETASSRPLSTRAALLTTGVEAVRSAINIKQQLRPKIFVIAFFSLTQVSGAKDFQWRLFSRYARVLLNTGD
jgi:hypothetical protein